MQITKQKINIKYLVVFMLLLNCCLVYGLEPPTKVVAKDAPNDAGGNIDIFWQLSVSDPTLEGYHILRRSEPEPEPVAVGFIGRGRNSFTDEGTTDGVKYSYQVIAVQESEEAASEWSNLVSSKPQWFHTGRINVIVFTFIFTFLIVFYINRAKRGANLFVRKIAGLLAVDEAIGRATEMGKPILYVPGLTGISDVATIAAMNILGEVAKKVATCDSQLIVPNTDPIVFTVAQEVVKEAYTQAGRPDAYKSDSVYFVTDSQFAYAAAVDGIMTRERPATNFFMGYFYAEALILAETGASTGAVQIAGTDSVMQLPFFIVACDYTLMGEELYAASAYLSREPLLLGGLIGQDWGKVVIVAVLILTSVIGLLTNLQVLKLF
ncbi:MAG: fibronectin type III domain-containing protein [Candidatus Latescibacteria bacterium]|nr:fibronectin type III domain-containing protein [Candidatus Latescibacterota bacterium]